MEWNVIEKAPKNGEGILAFIDDNNIPDLIFWDKKLQCWLDDFGQKIPEGKIMGWRYLI